MNPLTNALSAVDQAVGQQAWQPSNDEYHADTTRVSRSALEVFRKSRKEYYGRYVAKTLPAFESTEAMELGNMLHTAVFEPEKWASDYVVAPECDRRTKVGKAVWSDFIATAVGTQCVTDEQQQLVDGMREALYATEKSRLALELEGPAEHVITWTDAATGIACKCKRDKVATGFIIDIKTTTDASPDGFARSVARFRYHHQAAFYLRGHEAVTDERPTFLFLAVHSKPPYEVGVYDLSDRALALGESRVADSMDQLGTCMLSGDWRAPEEKRAITLDLPRYEYTNDDWSVT